MTNFLIQPLNDYVVLKPKFQDERTSSGLIVSTSPRKEESLGIIVSCGPQVTNLKIDDLVVYKNYSGEKLQLQEEEYLIVKSENIIAKIGTPKES
ncbi:MAG: co-chaperone GroES [Pigeon pea little leaf phytoplasma]|uniref:10 kDa chaperonin n=1 Tax=Candidatus Phytoplasma fabacearum TaxID=2982628 RepID=A0ABU8ZTB2_9MOLU|nr:co-chaperone GroES ['Bituminaria bituminosa' little leaf phytoplasma]MDV3158207.1 co-chaperone GroES [Pigeon pea little leaf phytoplasma]MDO8023740.1 co-chaperone GroES ['Bituminaria bituminosa' little leaf phytoplasma]MDV3158608.1 co-chaperone GroES [Pigeon pea little leaf phytoplasma]MDV3161478.1 co-chaperone GroES [Pigeon pea little leaf phytoplasma]MDV3195735.1 co-chaperone GroES [Pigeon pea little leaf phytoplasma]